MVTGFESFRTWFQGYEEQYTIIGGTACDLLMSNEDFDFRATKDIDLVLLIEALTADFGQHFWQYIKSGGYQHCNKSTGESQFYRFTQPSQPGYPYMIELFSRKQDLIFLPEDAVLTPIPIDDSVSSLSAILLDDAYYNLLRGGITTLNGVSVLDAGYIIPFKAKAWLDLTARKQRGESVDSKTIRKHKNDVFRLSVLLKADTKILLNLVVYQDMMEFIQKMEMEPVDTKQLGIINRDKQDVLNMLRETYANETASQVI